MRPKGESVQMGGKGKDKQYKASFDSDERSIKSRLYTKRETPKRGSASLPAFQEIDLVSSRETMGFGTGGKEAW